MDRSHHAEATFTVASWDETVVANVDDQTTTINGVDYPARGFSRADVAYAYAGDLVGTGTQAYLIAYRGGESAPGFAFEHVVGTLDGHDGSFVLQHEGSHDATGVHMHVTIVEGSGTGALSTICGEGTVEIVGHSESGYPLHLDYDL